MHRRDYLKIIFALILSSLFTIALFYLTLELPHLLDKILHNYYPDLFWQFKLKEEMLNNIRPIGYATLIIVIILIALGFILRKSYLSAIGSVTLYLPVFGYFAFAMFFLAGIGILRVLWLPLIEYSPEVLKLGSIVLIPYVILKDYVSIYVAYGTLLLSALILIFIGLFIFSIGTATWLYGRFKGYKIIDFWIYRYIRHPQYLGYILWSYGLLTLTYLKSYVRGAFIIPPSYPWLISTLIIIGIALYEENSMKMLYKKDYMEYKEKTAFMIPLPRWLENLIKWPLRIKREEKMIDNILLLFFYLLILTILSYIINIYYNI